MVSLGILNLVLTVAAFGLIYVLLTMGLNLHFGFTGLINFGHVAFFAAGAYTAAIMTIPRPPDPPITYAIGFDLPMPWGLPISLGAAAVAGGVLAFIIGLLSIRLRSHYLAIATFVSAEIVYDLIRAETWLTGGAQGLQNVPQPGRATLGPDLWHLAFVGFMLVVTIGVYYFLKHVLYSPYGRVLKTIRENERAARVLGKPTHRLKMTSFTMGGAIAGIAGGLYSHYVGVLVPEQFIVQVTMLTWAAMILGGTGSLRGPIFGGMAIIAFREATRYLPDIQAYPLLPQYFRWIVYGLIFVALLYYRPQGVLGNPNEIVNLPTKDEQGSENTIKEVLTKWTRGLGLK
jgi:branched-chain amino acid transport system permease protein